MRSRFYANLKYYQYSLFFLSMTLLSIQAQQFIRAQKLWSLRHDQAFAFELFEGFSLHVSKAIDKSDLKIIMYKGTRREEQTYPSQLCDRICMEKYREGVTFHFYWIRDENSLDSDCFSVQLSVIINAELTTYLVQFINGQVDPYKRSESASTFLSSLPQDQISQIVLFKTLSQTTEAKSAQPPRPPTGSPLPPKLSISNKGHHSYHVRVQSDLEYFRKNIQGCHRRASQPQGPVHGKREPHKQPSPLFRILLETSYRFQG